MTLFRNSALLIFVLFSAVLLGQEICNDAIDNDGDGLIDLNDDDCICESIVPSGLIPNPSFEQRTCCPDDKEQLYCAFFWEQASRATTDYVNTCGDFLGHRGIPNSTAPLPFPDGEGAVGFRDGEGNLSPQYKEYTGSSLIEQMEVGVTYRFDFFVGFPDRLQHPEVEIAVFATTRTDAIPFGGNNSTFGCPTNGPNFDLIGSQIVRGNFEWVNVVFEFVADKPYQAIVLGPGCADNPTWSGSPYFFLDRLAIAEKSDFTIPFSEITGEVCDDNIVLTADGDFTFQWYFNGVAILGEEEKTLSLDSNSEEGNYSALMTSPEGCFLSESYELEIPDLMTEVTMGICEGETLEFGTMNLTAAGDYTEVFPVGFSCDSTVMLTLEVYEHTESVLSMDICPGDTLEVGGVLYTEPGEFATVIPNYLGCDSSIIFELLEVDDIEQLIVEDTLFINLGETVDIIPSTVSPDAVRFEWTQGGDVVSGESSLYELRPIDDLIYNLSAYTENDCLTERAVTIIVDDNVETYIPNILSFQAFEPDNRFIIGANSAVSEINELRIYDRWGSLVYIYEGDIKDFRGWDGRTNNKAVEQGVYTYLIEFQILDGRTLKESGTLTVIR